MTIYLRIEYTLEWGNTLGLIKGWVMVKLQVMVREAKAKLWDITYFVATTRGWFTAGREG
ncbi:MAG: hypothetical protein BroJett011_14790 [Chloroflexota bacterium]|nr:MAG: hypothetical protein BroJett011_14790 [Chloroflexota bacterium]